MGAFYWAMGYRYSTGGCDVCWGFWRFRSVSFSQGHDRHRMGIIHGFPISAYAGSSGWGTPG